MNIDRLIARKADEEILEVAHEDLAAHFPKLCLLFAWVILPFFFLFPLVRLGGAGIFFFAAFLGAALLSFFRWFWSWSRTVLVVTDLRVMDIEQRGFFDRIVTEATYVQVDEVAYRMKGFFATIFRFGTIRVQLRGSGADIEFRRVRRPARLHDLLNDLVSLAHGGARNPRETRLKKLAASMTDTELRQIDARVRARGRDEALETLYPSEEDSQT